MVHFDNSGARDDFPVNKFSLYSHRPLNAMGAALERRRRLYLALG